MAYAAKLRKETGSNTGRETTNLKKSFNSNKILLLEILGVTTGKKSLKPIIKDKLYLVPSIQNSRKGIFRKDTATLPATTGLRIDLKRPRLFYSQ